MGFVGLQEGEGGHKEMKTTFKPILALLRGKNLPPNGGIPPLPFPPQASCSDRPASAALNKKNSSAWCATLAAATSLALKKWKSTTYNISYVIHHIEYII